MQDILCIYRERNCDPAFWAEPLNALSNIAFPIAALCAAHFAHRRDIKTPMTITLISLAAIIGVGSFVFHTVPNAVTLWLDVIPIATFQILFIWLMCHDIFGRSRRLSAMLLILIMGLSFALMPIREPLNGSLFYVPSLVAMFIFGALWTERSHHERFLLLAAASGFLLAITARSSDKTVPWAQGTHFLWHAMNGVVVYLVLRIWVVFLSRVRGLPSFPN